jgi:hypothetical protein
MEEVEAMCESICLISGQGMATAIVKKSRRG